MQKVQCKQTNPTTLLRLDIWMEHMHMNMHMHMHMNLQHPVAQTK